MRLSMMTELYSLDGRIVERHQPEFRNLSTSSNDSDCFLKYQSFVVSDRKVETHSRDYSKLLIGSMIVINVHKHLVLFYGEMTVYSCPPSRWSSSGSCNVVHFAEEMYTATSEQHSIRAIALIAAVISHSVCPNLRTFQKELCCSEAPTIPKRLHGQDSVVCWRRCSNGDTFSISTFLVDSLLGVSKNTNHTTDTKSTRLRNVAFVVDYTRSHLELGSTPNGGLW